eukprot:3196403-Karenia_brevis.AAC.1
MKRAASSGGGGISKELHSSNLACGKAIVLPLIPPCFVPRGARRSGSAMTLLTHIRPRANVFTVISLTGSPLGVNTNGRRPIQL